MEKVREELVYLIKRWSAQYVCFSADMFLAWSDEEFHSFIEMYGEFQLPLMNCYTFMPYHGTPLRTLAIKMGFLDPNAVTCSLTAGSVLDMPQYPRPEIRGFTKCFSLYARLPESTWPLIRRAEADDDEGNTIFSELREQYVAKFFNDGEITFS